MDQKLNARWRSLSENKLSSTPRSPA
jgi:hypothetical protein